MSIILNALKKSEHDRLVSQEKALANKTQEHLEHKQNKTPTWLFFLVCINVSILSYFIWDFTKKNSTVKNIASESFSKIDTIPTDISHSPTINLTKVGPQQTISAQVKKQTTTNKPILIAKKSIKPQVLKSRQSNTQSYQPIHVMPNKKKLKALLSLNETDVLPEIDKNKSANLKSPQIDSTNIIKPNKSQTKQSNPEIRQPIKKVQPKTNSELIVSLNKTDVVNKIGEKKSATLKKRKINSTNSINTMDLQTRQQAIKIDQNKSPVTTTKPQMKSTNGHNLQQTSTNQIKKIPTKNNTFEDKSFQKSSELLQSNKSDTHGINSENSDRPQKNTTNTNISNIDNNKVSQPPFLSDLDYRFIRTVPKIKINVYVYSENKNNRFIMVNMTKLMPEQEITEGMILKEIRMNSIVVDYDNRIFQIKRK